jgi:hypothetical protein
MIQITPKTQKIMDFIDLVKVCTVDHIHALFYPGTRYNTAQKRMTALSENGVIKRKRTMYNIKYIYYIDKEPAQIQHRLALTDLYVWLVKRYGESAFEAEFEYTKVRGVRPDAYIKLKHGGRTWIYFVEVHIGNNPLDIAKHEAAVSSGASLDQFPIGVYPTIVILTDKPVSVRSSTLVVKSSKLDLSGLSAFMP